MIILLDENFPLLYTLFKKQASQLKISRTTGNSQKTLRGEAHERIDERRRTLR